MAMLPLVAGHDYSGVPDAERRNGLGAQLPRPIAGLAQPARFERLVSSDSHNSHAIPCCLEHRP